MKRTTLPKLHLRHETLRLLNTSDLLKVKGAGGVETRLPLCHSSPGGISGVCEDTYTCP